MGGRCRPIWPLRSIAAVLLITACSLSAAASCYGRDACLRVTAHLDTSSSLPGIPLQPLNLGTGCETSTHVESPSERSPASPIGTVRKVRRLGQNEEVGTTGMRLSLARSSVHPSEANLHPKVLFQQSLERDSHRVIGVAKRTRLAAESKASSRSQFRADFPDLMNAGGKKQLNDDPPVNQTPGLYNFESSVASGVPFGSGEYFIDLYVGTPPRHFSAIIDTGSDLTWVQCDPCELCYHQDGPVFKPALSSTYEGLACNSDSCISAGGFGDDPNNCKKKSKKPGVCRYFYYYGDYSNTTGDYALETLTFNVSRGDPLQIEQILFGCGHSNIGLFQGAGGLLGLGQGAISFVSQVGNFFGNKFSYCLVDRDHPSIMRSPLIFGEDEVYAKLQAKFQWTPFLKNAPIDSFYYINITGVSVGDELLKIPETAWQIDMEGYGGTIIDSGTTLSYFRKEAYDVIKAAFEERISFPKVSDVPILDVCYNLTEVQKPNFPSFSITFEGSAVMMLPLKNYFIRPAPEENVYCLALVGVQSKNLNIIGNFQQQNFHVVYDRGSTRLGFAPVDCTGIL